MVAYGTAALATPPGGTVTALDYALTTLLLGYDPAGVAVPPAPPSHGTDSYSLAYSTGATAATPTGLTQTAATTTTVTLAWGAPVAGYAAAGYEVRVNGTTPYPIAPALAHIVTGLTPAALHTIDVRLVADNGTRSGWATITTHTAAPTPPAPAPAGFTERVTDAVGPAFLDHAGPLAPDVIAALSTMGDELDTLLTPATRPPLFDAQTTPHPGWLAAVTGTPIPTGLTVEAQREWLATRPTWRRGTLAALTAAIRAVYPTGRVDIVERHGSPWRLQVRIYGSEATEADRVAVHAAASTQKPVGIVLATVRTGGSYAHLAAVHGTYTAAAADFPTYATLRDHAPEEGTTP